MEFLVALFVTCLAAAIPTAVYVAIAWWFDRYEKEPWWLMALAFAWGAVPAIIVAAVVEMIFAVPLEQMLTGRDASVLTAVIVAPLVEESLKALPLLLIFLLYRREFDGLLDGLLYGALVGFGFAMTENVLYIMGGYSEAGFVGLFGVAFLRVIVFGMMHALWASMFGLGLGIARYARSSLVAWSAPVLGLLLGMALHAFHNFCGVSGGWWALLMLASYGLGCVGWLLLAIVAGIQESRWIREELKEEVTLGHVRPDIAAATSRYRSRIAARWAALRKHGLSHQRQLARLYSLVADLAFKKRQLAIRPQDPACAGEIARLRGEIAQLTESLFGEEGLVSIEDILEVEEGA